MAFLTDKTVALKRRLSERLKQYGASTSPTSRKILKVMSVFTGVEFLGILCSMIKMKIVALWLDAVGVGLFNIFNTTVETTGFLTSLGIRQSSVRDLSQARTSGKNTMTQVVRTVRSWSVVAAMLGGTALTACSWPLAEMFFGSGEMWWNFAILGGSMVLTGITAGESAILQATEKFMRLARAGLIGAVGGLLISVLLFYWLGNNGIALSVLAYALVFMIATLTLRNRDYDRCAPSRDMLGPGRAMIKLGTWISLTGFISSICQLAFITWLNRTASTAEVGLYGAGITLVVRYTGLIFSSVTLEFYPRVSASIFSPHRLNLFLNHEVALLLLLFTPMLLVFLIFREWIVIILYSKEFLAVVPFIIWGITVILLRAVSNTLAMCVLAKGEGKIYMITESVDALLGLGLSIWLYTLLGFEGLGIALVIWHFCYLLMVGIICRFRYSISLSGGSILLIAASLSTAAFSIAMIYGTAAIINVPVMSVLAAIYGYYFFRFLRRRRKSRTPVSQLAQ